MPVTSALPDVLAAQAISVATGIGGRLRALPGGAGLDGHCGAAILCDELDRLQPGEGWAGAAKEHLISAVGVAQRQASRLPSLFGGLGTVAFTAWCLSREGTRYQTLLTELDSWIVPAAAKLGDEVAANPAGRPFHDFDHTHGLAGIGAYLSVRPEGLAPVLRGLEALCGQTGDLPNWHTRTETLHPETPLAQEFPDGMVSCGLAHGIAGPLALLSLTSGAPRETVERVAGWLAAQRVDDECGPNWHAAVPLPGTPAPPRRHGEASWCYGSPGVALALLHASDFLGDGSLRTLAIEAMRAVFRRSPHARGIDRWPSLCHGVAGTLVITQRFAREADEFTAEVETLTEQLLSLYATDARYGYWFRSPAGPVDSPVELLDGVAGVALALLAAATGEAPAWGRALALS